MLRKVVCITLPGMAPFEFGVICEVFGIDRSDQGGPQFDFHIVAAEPGPIPMKLGFDIVVHEGLEAAADADLVAVPAYLDQEVHPEILRVVREAEQRGAWILSVCSGAFVLAEAGVLNGRRSTTHWMYTDRLAHDAEDLRVHLLLEVGGHRDEVGVGRGLEPLVHDDVEAELHGDRPGLRRHDVEVELRPALVAAVDPEDLAEDAELERRHPGEGEADDLTQHGCLSWR